MKESVNLVRVPDATATASLNSKGVIELTGQQLGPAGLEMPTINPKYIGKEYNFIYGTGFLEKGFYENASVKIDIKNNKTVLYKCSSTTYPGECVFVPKPNSESEDDGIILSLVLETDLDKNVFLAILDAKSFVELARIEFDRKEISIPTTIHGLWISDNLIIEN